MNQGTQIKITGDRGSRMDITKMVTYIKPCSFTNEGESFPALVRMANGKSAQYTGSKLFNYETTLMINCIHEIQE
jgi:hypothetical protein